MRKISVNVGLNNSLSTYKVSFKSKDCVIDDYYDNIGAIELDDFICKKSKEIYDQSGYMSYAVFLNKYKEYAYKNFGSSSRIDCAIYNILSDSKYRYVCEEVYLGCDNYDDFVTHFYDYGAITNDLINTIISNLLLSDNSLKSLF